MMQLNVKHLGEQRHAQIQSNWREHDDMPWNDAYIDFSGFFGAHNPKVFARAPEMLAALERARTALRFASEQSPAMHDDYLAVCKIIDEVKNDNLA